MLLLPERLVGNEVKTLHSCLGAIGVSMMDICVLSQQHYWAIGKNFKTDLLPLAYYLHSEFLHLI